MNNLAEKVDKCPLNPGRKVLFVYNQDAKTVIWSSRVSAIQGLLKHWSEWKGKRDFQNCQLYHGNSFVQKLACLLLGFADGSSLECVSMKTVIILQALVLQKPSCTSKTRDYISHLKRRMELWKAGNINKILLEGRCIQERIPKSDKHWDKLLLPNPFRIWCPVNKGLRLQSSNSSDGVLGLDIVISDSSHANSPCTTH